MLYPMSYCNDARVLGELEDGGAWGTRTPYLLNAIQALSQMS